MKKLIFLKQDYVDEKGINKTTSIGIHEKNYLNSIVLFKSQMKDMLNDKSISILKEVRPDAILIEYSDVINDKVINRLRKADVVLTIDAIISKELK